MKEKAKEEFIHRLAMEGVRNISPNSIEEALFCALLEPLSLPDLTKLPDEHRKIWEDNIIKYLDPVKGLFEPLVERFGMLEIPSNPKFFSYLKNKGFCSDYLYLDKKFENPYPEETLKYAMFQGSPAEWLTGMNKIEDLELRCTPTLPFSALIAQIEIIQRELFDTTKNLYDIRYTLKSLQVFLVTTKLEGKEHEVVNPFDGTKVITKIPKSLEEKECGSDALGMYVPANGCIYLWVDKIYHYRIHPLIFQKVLLHELIHFLFDIVRKSAGESNTTEKDDEETMDNFLILHTYKNAISPIENGVERAFSDFRDFISSQPTRYRKALKTFEDTSDWFSAREKLYNFLNRKK